jgi:hypothetical protein
VNVSEFDVPPPGAGLNTVTLAEPMFWTSVAVICAVNWPELLKPVVRGLPFQLTTAFPAKFEPLTVNVKPGLPAFAWFGLRLESVGTGFEPPVKLTVPDAKDAGKAAALTLMTSRITGESTKLICVEALTPGKAFRTTVSN